MNVESAYITALILALIISPPHTPFDTAYFSLATWAGIWAMAAKYIFAVKNKHLFNPAAFAVALTSLTINQSASWWVGNAAMLPFVLVGGILLVRKLGRFDLVFSFLIATVATSLLLSLVGGGNVITDMQKIVFLSPLFFFAFLILTEPLTTPPSHKSRVIYGILVGIV